MQGRVAFVLKGYPRLSETFIAQEIAALERRGLEILIVSLRRPTDTRRHAVHDDVRASILYLPEYLVLEPSRVIRAWLRQRKNPRYRETRYLWLRDLLRDEGFRKPRITLQYEGNAAQSNQAMRGIAWGSSAATAGSIQGATRRLTFSKPSSRPGTTISEGRFWLGRRRSAAAITAGS